MGVTTTKRSNFDKLAIMNQTKLFDGLSKVECEAVWSSFNPAYEKITKGETVFDEDDIVQHIGIIQSGTLLGTKVYPDGNAHLITIFLPQEIFGLEIVCTPSRRCPMRVHAEVETEVWWILADDLQNPKRLAEITIKRLMQNIIHLLANENIKKLHKFNFLTQKSLRDKIMTYLMHTADMRRKNSFMINMNREQLAQYLDVNRSTLSHELSMMRADGLITFRKNHFTILDTDCFIDGERGRRRK